MKLDGLIIRKPALDLILSGRKTWELRGSRCHKRGIIALIQSKSGTVVGTAELVDSIGPLSVSEFNRNLGKIGSTEKLKSADEFYYKKTFAWILKDAKRLHKPIPYQHRQGAVIWHPVEI